MAHNAVLRKIATDTSAAGEARVEGYTAAASVYQLEINWLREELSLAQERVAAFRQHVAEMNAEVSHLRLSRKEEKAELLQCQTLLKDWIGRASGMVASRRQLDAQVSSHRAEITLLKAENAKLRNMLKDL